MQRVSIQDTSARKPDGITRVPFAGHHAGKLKDYSANEVLTDADKMMDALLRSTRIVYA